jgi:hypothetical protein
MPQASICSDNTRLLDAYRARIVNEDTLIHAPADLAHRGRGAPIRNPRRHSFGPDYCRAPATSQRAHNGPFMLRQCCSRRSGIFGVRAAQKEIKTLADASKTLGPPPAGYPPVISAGHHTAGHILPWVLPILTAFMWFYFLAILMAKVVNHGPWVTRFLPGKPQGSRALRAKRVAWRICRVFLLPH